MTEEIEGLSEFVSQIKNPIWFREKEDFYAKCLIREFLQKCSRDKIVEMLKSILSVEERMGLVKTEMESFFQNQTKSFENHMMVKNELNDTDDQVQTRIKTEPKDIEAELIQKPEILFNKCILCSNTFENSRGIESHLTNVHSVSTHCQNQFMEKVINTELNNQSKPTETCWTEESFDLDLLESQTQLSNPTNEQPNEKIESSVEPIQNGDQDSDCGDSTIQSIQKTKKDRFTDSMAEIQNLSNNHLTIQSDKYTVENQEAKDLEATSNEELSVPEKATKSQKAAEKKQETEDSVATSNENLSLPKKATKNHKVTKKQKELVTEEKQETDSKCGDLNIAPVEEENYQEFSLPYGWKKVGYKRKSGVLKDQWDFHVLSPLGKKLRSNIAIRKYLEINPDIKCDPNVTTTSKKMVQNANKNTEENKEIEDSEATGNENLSLPKKATKRQTATKKEQETQDSEATSNIKLSLSKDTTKSKKAAEKKQETKDSVATSNENLSLPKKATKNHKVTKKQKELVTEEKQETEDSEATSNEKLPLPKIATEKKQVTEEKRDTQDFFPTSFYLVA